MLGERLPLAEAAKPSLAVGLARTPAEVREAQRLRHSVFADEMGARLATATPGVDADRFDPHCDHLVVRDLRGGEIIGTYRILPPHAVERAGGYYSAQEFDLARLEPLRSGLVEIGRSCIRADFRSGAVIGLLWAGLARYMLARGYRHLFGCASVGMFDGGHAAADLYRCLARDHLSPPEYRVFPACPLPLDELGTGEPQAPPPLLKGYLRAGAYVCGAPAWDPFFNTADLLVLLPMSRLNPRYARHYLGDGAVDLR